MRCTHKTPVTRDSIRTYTQIRLWSLIKQHGYEFNILPSNRSNVRFLFMQTCVLFCFIFIFVVCIRICQNLPEHVRASIIDEQVFCISKLVVRRFYDVRIIRQGFSCAECWFDVISKNLLYSHTHLYQICSDLSSVLNEINQMKLEQFDGISTFYSDLNIWL